MLFPFGTKCHEDDCHIYLICCCSSARSCPTLCDPMNCSLPGFPDLHYLPEFVQTQVPWAGDAIQPSHPLSLSSPPALNLSQHQGLSDEPSLPIRWPKFCASVSTSVLPVNIWGWFPLGMTGLTSLLSKDSDESSPASQFGSINSSVLSFLYGPTLTPYKTTGKTIALTIWTFISKVVSLLFNTCLGLSQLFF